MPDCNYALKALYEGASIPYPAKFLEGERYRVIALDGVPRLPYHHKYFKRVDDRRIVGHNRSIVKWGEYVVCYTISVWLEFRYKKYGIVDYVRSLGDGVYIGRYYRHDEFKGYFFLVREDKPVV